MKFGFFQACSFGSKLGWEGTGEVLRVEVRRYPERPEHEVLEGFEG